MSRDTFEEQYTSVLHSLVEKGKTEPVRPDRTGVGTFSRLGVRFTYGSDAFLTGKKIHFRSALDELCWMLRGETNVSTLRSKIWNEWSDKNGDLNEVYGAQWRRWLTSSGGAIELDRRTGPAQESLDYRFEMLEPEPGVPVELKGVASESCGLMTAIKKVSKPGEKNSRWLVQFHDTGATTVATRPNIRAGCVRDPYRITTCGVGCLGESRVRKVVYDLWRNMLARCYEEGHPSYDLYGGAGVYVSKRWLNLSLFAADLSRLPAYEEWLRNPNAYCLDKDYFGAQCYDVSTCLFLKKSLNVGLARNIPVYVDGRLFSSLKDAAEYLGVDRRRVSESLAGKRSFEWSSRIAPYEGESLVRESVFVDQIESAIVSLRENKFSRKIIVSAWNSGSVSNMALTPCHAFFQFRVRDCGEIVDLILTQPSGDIFLGVPFNAVNYFALLFLISKASGLIPGEVVHTIGDCHLYSNHLEAAEKYLEQEIKDVVPELSLSPKGESRWSEIEASYLRDIDLDDLSVAGYESGPFIRAPIAV